MTALATGMQAPDFILQTMGGTEFLAPGCARPGAGCRGVSQSFLPGLPDAFPFLERIYKNYGGKNVSFIGISRKMTKKTRLVSS